MLKKMKFSRCQCLMKIIFFSIIGHSFSLDCQPGEFALNDLNITWCSGCPPGKYSDVPGATICIDCPNGTYSTLAAASSSSACIFCPLYSSSPHGSSTLKNCSCNIGYIELNDNCTICPVGTYYTLGKVNACVRCQPGTFSEYQGSSMCASCPAGTYSTTIASSSSSTCTSCPSFSFADQGSSAAEACSCNAGYTQTKSDCYLSSLCPPVICDACIPGKYSKDRAASSCIVCAAGTYAAGASSGCLSCPEHSTSSSDSTTCTCSTGYISASFHIDAD